MIFARAASRAVARILTFPIALAGLLAASQAGAQGDLLVAPTRIVMEDRSTAMVILSNIGTTEETYRISAELRRMTEEGVIEHIDIAEANAIEQAALELVRFAPRRVVLPPGQPQAVRVSARGASELPDGEYRVHLTFNAVPKPKPVTEEALAEEATNLKIQLTPIYAITIPLIVRKGAVQSAATISNPRVEQLENGRNVFKLHMARTGNGSTFGEIRVTKPGLADPVFMARGIAVYPEVNEREFALGISPEEAEAMKGQVRVEYRELPEQGGALLASVDGMIGS